MLIEMIPNGKSKSPVNTVQKAVNYLLGDKDSHGTTRSVKPDLADGDVDMFLEQTCHGNQPGKFTSGVLSFMESPERIPDEVRQAIRESHKQASFPGLDPNRVVSINVVHGDKGRYEDHFLYGGEDLATSKRINGYQSHVFRNGRKVDIDFERMDAWKDMTNAFYGFDDPKDPLYRRGAELDNRKAWPKDIQDMVSTINSYVAHKVAEGDIKNRKDVISQLQEKGMEVTRETRQSISIKNPDRPDGRPIRLKGEFFEKDFVGDAKRTQLKIETDSEDFRARRWDRYHEAKEKYDRLYEIKATYYEKRFANPKFRKGKDSHKSRKKDFRKRRSAKHVGGGGRLNSDFDWGKVDQSHTIGDLLFKDLDLHRMQGSRQRHPIRQNPMPAQNNNTIKERSHGKTASDRSRNNQDLNAFVEGKRTANERFERTIRVHADQFERVSEATGSASRENEQLIAGFEKALRRLQEQAEQDISARGMSAEYAEADRKIDKSIEQLTTQRLNKGRRRRKNEGLGY